MTTTPDTTTTTGAAAILDGLAAAEAARHAEAAAATERAALGVADPAERQLRSRVAGLLGVKAKEIRDLYTRPEGIAVVLRDDLVRLIVPADRPDAEGKTGVMWLVRPPQYVGSWGTYARTPCPDPKYCPHRPGALPADKLAEAQAMRGDLAQRLAASVAGDLLPNEQKLLDWALAEWAVTDAALERRLNAAPDATPLGVDAEELRRRPAVYVWAATMLAIHRGEMGSWTPARLDAAHQTLLVRLGAHRVGNLRPTMPVAELETIVADSLTWMAAHEVPVPQITEADA